MAKIGRKKKLAKFGIDENGTNQIRSINNSAINLCQVSKNWEKKKLLLSS